MQDVARIKEVVATGPSVLAVTWTDGTTSAVDLVGWIARGGRRFAALGNALVFAEVKVGLYGGNATWDDEEGDLAIDSEHLRMIADHQVPFDAAGATRWQVDMRVSNVEAADLLGIAPSTWAAYKAGTAIPATVARLCRAMRDEPSMLSAHLRPRTAGNPGRGPLYVIKPVPVDGNECAALRLSGKRTGYLYLSDAVRAFYALPDEQQARATIQLRDGGRIYKAAEIRRFHDAPPADGAPVVHHP